jgi:coniferyl-aldehyde dehydrogenase
VTDLQQILHSQRVAHLAQPYPSVSVRRVDLQKLRALISDNTESIVQAITADYGHRSRHETMLAEVVPVLQAVDHALKHLKRWMKPQRRGADWVAFFGSQNRVLPQPLGLVGIIVPWNFPINLSFMVLVDVFAAGNRAMVKMSENSRHITRLLMDLAPRYFSADKLAFVEETGGVGVAFSQLKFDHLVFTGSTQTGKAVMAAAAQNLCPESLAASRQQWCALSLICKQQSSASCLPSVSMRAKFAAMWTMCLCLMRRSMHLCAWRETVCKSVLAV